MIYSSGLQPAQEVHSSEDALYTFDSAFGGAGESGNGAYRGKLVLTSFVLVAQ